MNENPTSLPRRIKCCWRISAALTRDPAEPFDGLNVVKEIPGDFGVALWQSLRDVELWAASEDRGALFQPTYNSDSCCSRCVRLTVGFPAPHYHVAS